jgi:hypothetical protein
MESGGRKSKRGFASLELTVTGKLEGAKPSL